MTHSALSSPFIPSFCLNLYKVESGSSFTCSCWDKGTFSSPFFLSFMIQYPVRWIKLPTQAVSVSHCTSYCITILYCISLLFSPWAPQNSFLSISFHYISLSQYITYLSLSVRKENDDWSIFLMYCFLRWPLETGFVLLDSHN